ncbi:LuxR C-terminal-related transcriptional regulator [Burkholderia sp. Bp8991]|uniref:LuxR C-terminal-related transcriptional regulator n=1 Tax=Burkholderia sp. Bp8991 TaxID=2184553 RepID=UPI0039089DF3
MVREAEGADSTSGARLDRPATHHRTDGALAAPWHGVERTVKFHLVNAMRKLNSANKTEAAVKAAMLGLLF